MMYLELAKTECSDEQEAACTKIPCSPCEACSYE